MKIYWDNKEMEGLMKSSKISTMEQDIMMQKLDQIKAAFMQEFGFDGKFDIQSKTTSGTLRIKGKLHGGRISFRIRAADARTAAVLKRQPGWLGKFIN